MAEILSEEPAAVFEQAEELIREHRYQEALTLLKAMAEKTAGQIIEKFPKNYRGHHLYCLIMTERKDYDRLARHFQEICEVFGQHPQYLIDRLASLEKEGKESEVLKLINEDPAVMEVIPELALRKKVQILLKREERKEAKEIIDILFRDYKDPDAVIASIIIDMVEGNNARAGAAANVILEQEKETRGPRFFLAMYLQIFIFYAAYNGRPPEEVRDLMQREASLCIEWMEQNDLETTQMQESLSEVLHEVRN